MRKYVTGYCLIIIILFSCQSSSVKNQQSPEEKVEVFPVTDFLLGQVNEIAVMPVTLLKITNQGNHQDSQWISRDSIHKLSIPFLFPVIDSAHFNKNYSAHSFLDQTVNAFTFTYDAIKSSSDTFPLTHVDVYIDPESRKVQRIYMIKEKSIEGKTRTQQLTWNTQDGFMIRTIIKDANDSVARIIEEKVLWKF
ncbi:MAG: hypothetical protein ABI784_01475 [Ginsengibacter sp.]